LTSGKQIKPKITYEDVCFQHGDLGNEIYAQGMMRNAGVVVSTGLGDGCYDVVADIVDDKTWGRRIKSISVKFF
jgi:hypothetical protein